MSEMSSAQQQSEGSVEEKNAAACPVVEAVEEVGSQWRLVVLSDLEEGEKRFNELNRSTGDLEDASLVNRRVEDRPVATYYSLAPKGEALCPVFDEVEAWAEEWL